MVIQAQGLDQHEVALGYIQQAKELLHLLEAEVHYYISMDYMTLCTLMEIADSLPVHVVLQFWP